ncbi:MAG: cation-binding protein [Parcubacteria group bacterium]|jgi:hemerythrin-like domain-containing protein|nr:cation-binding protein [Parcubacteria group bacterium]|tara:strand:+ start:6740 stop:7261 length:522 start_codon:yes stop_codon:yes gene_type:complete
MEKPFKMLSDEHQNILKVIEALTKEVNALETGQALNKDFFNQAIDFIKNYADKFHHVKEEDILFKELSKDSVQMDCNPMEQMLHEHDLGRGFVKGIKQGLERGNKEQIIKNSKEYSQLLQEHIFKEDNILYPMADQSLDQKTQQAMLKEFKQAEDKKFAQGTKDKYLSFVKKL